MRWASLLPEATQWFSLWHRERLLVARSHLCEGSAYIQALPVCTRVGGPSVEWEKYLGPYPPDFAVLSSLRPDALFTMLPLQVPDLAEEELLGRLRQALGYPVQVFVLQATKWEEYIQRVPRIGEALGVPNPARKWVSEVLRRKDFLQQKTRSLSQRLSVALLRPGELPYGIGGWASELAQWAGLQLACPEGPFSWEKLLHTDPDVIVLTFRGASLAAAGEALAQWARLPQVQHLKAFRQKRLYAFKGTAGIFFPSPYLIAAAEALYELAYTPTYRYNQHLGTLWAPLL